MASWSYSIRRLIQNLNNFSLPGRLPKDSFTLSRIPLGIQTKVAGCGSSKLLCKPFLVDGVQVGYITPTVLTHLYNYNDVFATVLGKDGEVCALTLTQQLKAFDERAQEVHKVMRDLREKDIFSSLRGWRDEMYPVMHSLQSKASFMMERSATCLLGITQYGIHLNGYFTDDNGAMFMWIAKRSSTKQTWPGKLDQIVAGGISYGYGVQQTLVKECAEEASIPPEIATMATAAGCVSYFFEDERGLFPEVQFVYDLRLPAGFEPRNSDAEVEKFYCWPMDKVKEKIAADEFKPNCALVVLDFMIRHGIIRPDNEPFYLDYILGLHSPAS